MELPAVSCVRGDPSQKESFYLSRELQRWIRVFSKILRAEKIYYPRASGHPKSCQELSFVYGKPSCTKLKDISQDNLSVFLSIYSGHSVRYRAKIVSALRNFIKLLGEDGFIPPKTWQLLPNVRYSRNAFIQRPGKRKMSKNYWMRWIGKSTWKKRLRPPVAGCQVGAESQWYPKPKVAQYRVEE